MANNRNNAGTGFVNYNDILKANQQSGTRMGKAIAGGLESQGEAVKSDLQKQQDEFNQKYGQEKDKWGNVSALAKQLAEQGGLGTQAGWTNIAGVQDEDLTKGSENFNKYTYGGPTALKNTSGLQAQAQSASESGRLAGNAQGQQQLLGQYVGGRGYNAGQSAFDQALLNKYGRNEINQAKKGLVGIGEKTNTAIAGAQSAAQTQDTLVKAERENYKKNILAALGGDDDVGGKSVLGQAAGQAKFFKEEARGLNDLLNSIASQRQSSPLELERKIKELKDAGIDPQQLLSRVQEFGIREGDTYARDNARTANNINSRDLNDLISQYILTPDIEGAGNRKYVGDQQRAAMNLAKFVGDQQRAEAIQKDKFNSDVFNINNADIAQKARDRLELQAIEDPKVRQVIENTKHLQNLGNLDERNFGAANAGHNMGVPNPAEYQNKVQQAYRYNSNHSSITPEQQRLYKDYLADDFENIGHNPRYTKMMGVTGVQGGGYHDPGDSSIERAQFLNAYVNGMSPFVNADTLKGSKMGFGNLLNMLAGTNTPAGQE